MILKTKPLKTKPTRHGFRRADFVDVNGNECSLQESSAAEVDAVWLGVNEPNPKIFPGDCTGWHDYLLPDNVLCSTRMHLACEHVVRLLPLLQAFVKTGRLPREAKLKIAKRRITVGELGETYTQ